MTTDDTMTIAVTADDPVVKAMQEINRAFFSAAQRLGVPVALEGLANILVINLAAAYGEKVVPVEIPLTATAGSASAEFGTVYDQPRKRATQAYDRLVEYVEDQIGTAWARQLSDAKSTPGVAA